MNSFLIFGIIFIPLYIIYNLVCIKRKKISIWINFNTLKVIEASFFSFQFKSSIIICLLMLILIIIATISQRPEGSLPLVVAFFSALNYAARYFAIKKGYADKIN